LIWIKGTVGAFGMFDSEIARVASRGSVGACRMSQRIRPLFDVGIAAKRLRRSLGIEDCCSLGIELLQPFPAPQHNFPLTGFRELEHALVAQMR
jgi:hypothetical protein